VPRPGNKVGLGGSSHLRPKDDMPSRVRPGRLGAKKPWNG